MSSQKTKINASDLIYPVFVKDGLKEKEFIKGFPGTYRYCLNDLPTVIRKCEEFGISGVLVFGIPIKKDDMGTCAYSSDGVVVQAVRKIKECYDITVYVDVCLCAYTSHGHCGVLTGDDIDNEKTLPLLAKAAVSYAEAGADYVAPSAMIAGQVKAIRGALDESDNYRVKIMGYSAKFASHFYGPFREAMDSKPSQGPKDRIGYQLDYHDRSQALAGIKSDIEAGADIVMVKPAMPYLDVIVEARQKFDILLAAYQVSGEYAMVKSLDDPGALYESLIAIKRAGADFIISYGAVELLEYLNENRNKGE